MRRPSVRIERRAFGELNPRVEIERGFFGAHRLVDFPLRGHLRDGIVVKLQVSFEFAEFARLRQATKRIHAGNLGEFQRRLHHFLNALGRKIRRVGRTRPLRAFLARQHTDASAARARFLQVFDFLHAHADREFLAFGDRALGVRRATGERLLHGVGGDLF